MTFFNRHNLRKVNGQNNTKLNDNKIAEQIS